MFLGYRCGYIVTDGMGQVLPEVLGHADLVLDVANQAVETRSQGGGGPGLWGSAVGLPVFSFSGITLLTPHVGLAAAREDL